MYASSWTGNGPPCLDCLHQPRFGTREPLSLRPTLSVSSHPLHIAALTGSVEAAEALSCLGEVVLLAGDIKVDLRALASQLLGREGGVLCRCAHRVKPVGGADAVVAMANPISVQCIQIWSSSSARCRVRAVRNLTLQAPAMLLLLLQHSTNQCPLTTVHVCCTCKPKQHPSPQAGHAPK